MSEYEGWMSKFVKCAERLSSNHDAEVVTAARTMLKMMKEHGATWTGILGGGNHECRISDTEWEMIQGFRSLKKIQAASGDVQALIKQFRSFVGV